MPTWSRVVPFVAILLAIASGGNAQQPPKSAPSVALLPEDHRPPLFLRETWKDPGVQEIAVTQEHITGPALELKLRSM
jgi:hypothetical protein